MISLITFLCFTIVVGRNASADGSVLVGHNVDAQNVTEYYVNRTREGLWVQVPGLNASDVFVNKWGVGIVSDDCQPDDSIGEYTDGTISFELGSTVYQQARSAKDAVKIIGDLVDKRGDSYSGRSYVVADSKEAWVVSIAQDCHWEAQRVPDDAVRSVMCDSEHAPFTVIPSKKLNTNDLKSLLCDSEDYNRETTIYSTIFRFNRSRKEVWFCPVKPDKGEYYQLPLKGKNERKICKVNHVVLTMQPCDNDVTSEIQEKLDKCFLAGGGKLILKEGVYNVGGIRLRSNTILYLEKGAKLVASRNCEDYNIIFSDRLERLDPEDSCGRDVRWIRPKLRKNGQAPHITCALSRWNDAIIRIYKAENVAIIGEPGSVIDGSNSYDPEGEEFYRGVHGISAHKCRNLVFKGYTIQNTGNWAHLMRNCSDAVYEDVEILAGHDGVHISTCDSVTIKHCVMKTGDDCVAGFDNRWIWVSDCVFNTACSAFRFGGSHVFVDNCRCYGPGEYPIRGSLSKEEKLLGEMGTNSGRRNMLSIFTYYADKTLVIREKPGDIHITNMECDNIDRFLHYNFSGNETWQLGMPLCGISFVNVHARGIKLPLCAYSTKEEPFCLELENCSISFSEPVKEVIRGAYIGTVKINNLKVEGVSDIPLVRSWEGPSPVLEIEKLSGAVVETAPSDGPFKVKSI